jgi:hypothetical protein
MQINRTQHAIIEHQKMINAEVDVLVQRVCTVGGVKTFDEYQYLIGKIEGYQSAIALYKDAVEEVSKLEAGEVRVSGNAS